MRWRGEEGTAKSQHYEQERDIKSYIAEQSFKGYQNGVIPYFQPDELSGEIAYQGKDLLDLDMSERSNIVATVFQNPKTQFYAVNSTDEMAFALENRHLPPKTIFQRINQFTQYFRLIRW